MALAARDNIVHIFLADPHGRDHFLNYTILPVNRTELVKIEYQFGKLPGHMTT
jgi:hypothetical protein